MYPPPHQHSAALPPTGELHIGYGSSLARPLKFYLKAGEEYDVGYLRLFVSSSPVPMENIQQVPISLAARHLGQDPAIEDTGIWDVRTIVLRVDRNEPTVDTIV